LSAHFGGAFTLLPCGGWRVHGLRSTGNTQGYASLHHDVRTTMKSRLVPEEGGTLGGNVPRGWSIVCHARGAAAAAAPALLAIRENGWKILFSSSSQLGIPKSNPNPQNPALPGTFTSASPLRHPQNVVRNRRVASHPTRGEQKKFTTDDREERKQELAAWKSQQSLAAYKLAADPKQRHLFSPPKPEHEQQTANQHPFRGSPSQPASPSVRASAAS